MRTLTMLLISLLPLALVAFSLIYNDPAVQFLNSLNPAQRNKTQLLFEDPSKFNWHFLPGNMWPRAGIQLAELNDSQKGLFNNLLQSSLSESGYSKTMKIIDLENVLREISGNSVMRDPDKYFIAFYGNPESDSLWAWSFEGHHISLNFTVLNDKTSIAPRFLGASPARIPSGPRMGERTLDKEEDLGFELINSLSDEQKKIAIFQQKAFSDIVTMNSIKVGPLNPVGIKFSDLNENQQTIFLNLIDEYLSTMTEELAGKRMENLKKEEMNEVMFGWAGGIKSGQGHYYRIQGKSFLVEYDNTQGNANHIHTVWRDFNGDFGMDLIREHYKKSDHHK